MNVCITGLEVTTRLCTDVCL